MLGARKPNSKVTMDSSSIKLSKKTKISKENSILNKWKW